MEPQPARIMRIAWMLYLPMMASALFMPAQGGFRVPSPALLGQGLGAALVLGALVVGFSRWASRHTAWGRALRAEFQGFLAGLDTRQVVVLALLSGLGEEILFRGVLQPWLGWVWASLLFGLLHAPIRRTLWPWSLFALAMGFLLAGLTEWSGTLWPAIVLHFMINLLNLHDLARPG